MPFSIARRSRGDAQQSPTPEAATAILAERTPAPVLNVASGRSYGIGDVAERLRGMARQDIAIEVDPKRVRPNYLKRTLGDAGLARRTLDWSPAIDLDETLRDVLDYWRGRIRPAAKLAAG